MGGESPHGLTIKQESPICRMQLFANLAAHDGSLLLFCKEGVLEKTNQFLWILNRHVCTNGVKARWLVRIVDWIRHRLCLTLMWR